MRILATLVTQALECFIASGLKHDTYQIVGEDEADIKLGRVNISSPIARALIGKSEGDSVEVKAPGGVKSYEVVAVSYV